MSKHTANQAILLFDGECNFCDLSVQFIIKRDPEGYFSFAALQSANGQNLREQYNIPQKIDSFILIENEQYYVKSSAALRVCRHLQGLWKLFYALLILPSPLRDFFYNQIAKNRYKWFGKKESCLLPTPEIRKRFLD